MFGNIASRYAKARVLPTLMLRPSGFLYNTRNAESYTLSPVAACLLQALLRGAPPDELWREVVQRFEVSEPMAQRDSLQFLSTLHQLGLLTLDEAEEEDEEDEEDEAGEDEGEGEDAAAGQAEAAPRVADALAAAGAGPEQP